MKFSYPSHSPSGFASLNRNLCGWGVLCVPAPGVGPCGSCYMHTHFSRSQAVVLHHCSHSAGPPQEGLEEAGYSSTPLMERFAFFLTKKDSNYFCFRWSISLKPHCLLSTCSISQGRSCSKALVTDLITSYGINPLKVSTLRTSRTKQRQLAHVKSYKRVRWWQCALRAALPLAFHWSNVFTRTKTASGEAAEGKERRKQVKKTNHSIGNA